MINLISFFGIFVLGTLQAISQNWLFWGICLVFMTIIIKDAEKELLAIRMGKAKLE